MLLHQPHKYTLLKIVKFNETSTDDMVIRPSSEKELSLSEILPFSIVLLEAIDAIRKTNLSTSNKPQPKIIRNLIFDNIIPARIMNVFHFCYDNSRI
jgi:hypothetical protein